MSQLGSGGRRIFIGDVQGCREELEALLAAVRFDPAGDQLRPVGDLVNRGPDNVGVLRLLSSLGACSVLGNHDLHLLRCAQGTRRVKGRDTIRDVLEHPERGALLGYLAAQPFLRADDDLFQVHAALEPTWRDPAEVLAGIDPLQVDPRSEFCTRVRYCDSQGRLPQTDRDDPGEPFAPWHDFYDAGAHGGRSVVYGHWAVAGLVRTSHTLGLDTGCVWGGSLTAWIAEEDRLVQVPARRVWSRF
ncbi:metallophosphoesterase [Engelhardtia mirabilis]|uniref:Bis(5'-nucleosyl)-tetraphosphatase, symmetrical n=1 Tax=Engelhardtia mirabilis TaxID=2528011 RepID=A0A518BKW9_9BACT|nr:Bis(5'-nucleosyl)-tetraphosphatase, symmetrical [Planctomycetes bacterium Pla133]QDV01943.1 Bis(5'-nucleosyl)-tetraphosphatase, symmetrical [Planctomycetes bacterium Pla86]